MPPAAAIDNPPQLTACLVPSPALWSSLNLGKANTNHQNTYLLWPNLVGYTVYPFKVKVVVIPLTPCAA